MNLADVPRKPGAGIARTPPRSRISVLAQALRYLFTVSGDYECNGDVTPIDLWVGYNPQLWVSSRSLALLLLFINLAAEIRLDEDGIVHGGYTTNVAQ